MKIEMYCLTRRQRCQFPAWSKKSNIFPSVTTHVKPPGFKQLNWRIRENLSQAINNGSWYKLSLLVSEDAMTVPATCIYSIWRFTQNSWDMSPWKKHHYLKALNIIKKIGLWQSNISNGSVYNLHNYSTSYSTRIYRIRENYRIYIILSGLHWKIALHQKPSSSSTAATTSWSILMGGFLELSYGLSFLVVTILASTFPFLSSKSLYQERSQDFPGVRTIFKTYPNFLLSSLVTFPQYIC